MYDYEKYVFHYYIWHFLFTNENKVFQYVSLHM